MNELLRADRLSKSFGTVHAVRDVSFTVRSGEIVGLVGESGSGKSTVANLVLGLETADRGDIAFSGRPLPSWLASSAGRDYRAAVQAVFQDPVQAMDSRKTIGWSIAEPLVIHRAARGARLREQVHELMASVHLDPALAGRLPHEVSGGQAQRANIARALALNPSLLVCDEAVSALDVSVQAQILNLFLDIQRRTGMAMLFISHALPVVRHLADRIVVMYAGAVVESGPTEEVCDRPLHPYTRRLIASSPSATPPPEPARTGPAPVTVPLRDKLPGDGCRFAPRCPHAEERCRTGDPALLQVSADHAVACWRPAGAA